MPVFCVESQAPVMSADTPMNAAVLVPTPAMGLIAEGTSST
jgi:hypothetical protein